MIWKLRISFQCRRNYCRKEERVNAYLPLIEAGSRNSDVPAASLHLHLVFNLNCCYLRCKYQHFVSPLLDPISYASSSKFQRFAFALSVARSSSMLPMEQVKSMVVVFQTASPFSSSSSLVVILVVMVTWRIIPRGACKDHVEIRDIL